MFWYSFSSIHPRFSTACFLRPLHPLLQVVRLVRVSRSAFVLLLLWQCCYYLPIVMKDKHMFAYLQQIVFTGKSGKYSYIQRMVQRLKCTANNNTNCSTKNTVFEPFTHAVLSRIEARKTMNRAMSLAQPETLIRIRVRRSCCRGIRWFGTQNISCECNTVKLSTTQRQLRLQSTSQSFNHQLLNHQPAETEQ